MSALDTIRRRVRDVLLGAMPPSRVIRRGPGTARRVALTFDDGPDDLTPEYLAVLDRLGVAATFFLMGDSCAARPRIVREYLRHGHQIAGHGWDHRAFSSLTPAELRDQLRRSEAVLGPQATAHPWVRPPYGAMSARVLAQLLGSGHTIALWSVEPGDHEIRDPEALAARCAPEHLQPGDVLLLHEGQRWTLEALPRIVGNLQDAGYECVTMADLFSA